MPLSPRKHGAPRRPPRDLAPRPAAHRRGYDHAWSEIRAAKLVRNPFCERCEREGRLAWERLNVDHIIPVRIAPEKRLDIENTQTLCRKCHARKTHEDQAAYPALTQ
jgi:5-methylcytosine-specific restriction endonuclease McrA